MRSRVTRPQCIQGFPFSTRPENIPAIGVLRLRAASLRSSHSLDDGCSQEKWNPTRAESKLLKPILSRRNSWNHVLTTTNCHPKATGPCWAWNTISTTAAWRKSCCTCSSCGCRRSTAAPSAWTCTGRTCSVDGENEQRMYSLDAWRETSYYTERERAALAWAEAVTNITGRTCAGLRVRGDAPPLQ